MPKILNLLKKTHPAIFKSSVMDARSFIKMLSVKNEAIPGFTIIY